MTSDEHFNRILTINSGSSSVKFAPFHVGRTETLVFSGRMDRILALNTERTQLKIRVVNIVDLMKLQPQSEHPHGLSDTDFDELFTRDKPVIFAFHAYQWLIHRLTYRRTNHDNFHVRGYKEEDTITTPFDMTVMNELDRFHLVMDAIDRLPQTGDKGIYLKQQLAEQRSLRCNLE